MNRSRAFIRHQRFRCINRKKKIIHDQNDYWHYKYEGELSKGKIHCSCWLCAGKTRIHGKTINDIRKQESMDLQEREYIR